MVSSTFFFSSSSISVIRFFFVRLVLFNHSIVNMHILIQLVVNHGSLAMIIHDLFVKLLKNVIHIYRFGIHYSTNKKNKAFHRCYHFGQTFLRIRIHSKPRIHLWLVMAFLFIPSLKLILIKSLFIFLVKILSGMTFEHLLNITVLKLCSSMSTWNL